MSGRYRVCRAGRGVLFFAFAVIAGAAPLVGCTDLKQAIGMEPTMPNEFAVESNPPLMIPPGFDLRPPEPGAAPPHEKPMDQQAEQVLNQAGPGKPGEQASNFSLRRPVNGLGGYGTYNPQAPNPNAAVASGSLASTLLNHADTGSAGATVEKRQTTPLSGVY